MKNNKHLLLVGLGNPGVNYDKTRHNIGFDMINAIADNFDFPSFSNKFSAQISAKTIDSLKVILFKPQTFMNLSGNSVSQIIQFYKISLSDVIVIHDDLDMSLGKIKIKLGGGSGGHNGIKSIDQQIGSGYYRLKIGIGKPEGERDISNYVLTKFLPQENIILTNLEQSLLQNFDLLLKKDLTNFMNKMAMEYQKNGI